MKRNVEKLIEAQKQAISRTKDFVSSVDHGQSHVEILSEYEAEILRLNREIILNAQQNSSLIEIKHKMNCLCRQCTG